MLNRRGFLVFSTSALAFGCSKGSKNSAKSQALLVGMDLSYPPFEMQDKSGNPDGVGVKMAGALAAHLGRNLKIVPMEFSGLIPALKTGNIEIILSSMTATDERRKSIDFSNPYAFTGLALLVRKDSDIQSIEDLKKPGRKITAKTSTTGEIWATNHIPQAGRVVFEDQAACVLEVAQGRADAFIYDQLSIYKYAEENKETTRGLLKPFVEESWAIGIAKGNDQLLAQVNAFLDDFRKQSAGIPFILR
jgi:polar amino acid transport system substrate-binding protein